MAELTNWVLLFLGFMLGSILAVIAWYSSIRVKGVRVLDTMLALWLVASSLAFLFMYIWGIGRHGKTLGKHWMKLRVTRPDGRRVGTCGPRSGSW